jgi:hypothetical protein
VAQDESVRKSVRIFHWNFSLYILHEVAYFSFDMPKLSFASFVFLVTMGIMSCAVGPRETRDELVLAQATPSQQEPCKPSRKHVEFQNVSFEYDPCAFGDVKSEKVSDHRLGKADEMPDGVEPGHIDFAFDRGPEGWKPTVDVFPLADFPKMYEVNKKSQKEMADEIQDLKIILKNKDFRKDHQIPYLRWIDASQEFQTNVKLASFQNGNGIFFVTYLSTEAILVGNDHLRYIFEGITNDGKYILAEVPIRAPFLKDESPEEFEGYTREFYLKDYVNRDNLAPRYKKYILSVTVRLEAMRPDEFQPDLRKLEDLIASLKISN